MQNDHITKADLTDMARNIRIVYGILHPNGLKMEELAALAEEHTFYRGIYQHCLRKQGVSA